MTKARDLADFVSAGNPLADGTIDVADINGITATTAELNYTDGVTSNIQTQLDARLPLSGGTMTGDITFSGTQLFDGRDVSADGTKLDGIETGATADQTKADIDALGINAATLGGNASAYFTGTDLESVLNEIEAQIGGATSSTFNFTENNVLADNDFVYPALEKLDLKFGDLASTANGEGASLVGVEDSAGNFTATDVEGVLSELYDLASVSTGETATVGAGGVTKGDLLYYSAADTVLPMPINANNRCVGIALETVAAAGQVKYARWDELVDGVLTGASFGTRYYWDGSSLTTTIPSGSGQYVWQAGIAKNSTDLLATVEFVKKNV